MNSFPLLDDNAIIRDDNQRLLLSSPVTRSIDKYSRERFYIKHNEKEYTTLYEKYNNAGVWILCSDVIPYSKDKAVMADTGVYSLEPLIHLMNIIDDLFQCRKKSFEAVFSICKGENGKLFPSDIVNLVMEYF